MVLGIENIKQVEFEQANELGKSCVMIGKIYDMDEATLNEDGLFTADVGFGGSLGTIQGIPIVYNCEDGLKDQPFTYYKNEKVLVLNRKGKKNPTASDLTIVGFEDGVPRYCKKYLYIKTGISLFLHSDVSAYRCFVWDIEEECFANVRNGEKGGFISFPRDPKREDIKAWVKQRTSHGKSLWDFLGICGQASWPGDDIIPCEKNGLEDIETGSYKFYPAWATGGSGGHSRPSWCANSAFCPTVESMAGSFIDRYSAAGKPYVRVECEENSNGAVDGTVQVFTHLNEDESEGIGNFSYTVNWQTCAGWQARTSMNIPRFIRPFGDSKLSNTAIVQIMGVTVSTMDIIENCGWPPGSNSTYNHHTKHFFVAQANLFPEGTKDVDIATLTRCIPLEEAISEAFNLAYDEIVPGHVNEHDVSWWTPVAMIDFLGGGD
jgi:hypothetical protein